jgi:hypothetical protein
MMYAIAERGKTSKTVRRGLASSSDSNRLRMYSDPSPRPRHTHLRLPHYQVQP